VFGKDSIDEVLLRIRQAMQESVFPGGETMCRDDAPLGWQVRDINVKLIKAGLWDHANAGSAGRDVEMALRFGVNLIMHVLTGNYKSDQVHVPALLDRLGQ
jgi:hypothetical protein